MLFFFQEKEFYEHQTMIHRLGLIEMDASNCFFRFRVATPLGKGFRSEMSPLSSLTMFLSQRFISSFIDGVVLRTVLMWFCFVVFKKCNMQSIMAVVFAQDANRRIAHHVSLEVKNSPPFSRRRQIIIIVHGRELYDFLRNVSTHTWKHSGECDTHTRYKKCPAS